MKIRRNQPCPCGSGKKFKHCHGGNHVTNLPNVADLQRILRHHQADQLLRQGQQGLGRPIVAAKFNDFQFVAVGDRLYYSKEWKTFLDFLSAYLKDVLGSEWGNAEIAKPFKDRHTIMQWYDELCRYQKEHAGAPGEVFSTACVGVVCCCLGLAYSLYLLHHNVELQSRLVKRLKNPANFQGAYFELIVANALIRAGFELELEDETDPTTKHCEFSARSLTTKQKYSVEAKMRSVVGLLGKTAADGTPSQNPISHLVDHLNAALAKPSELRRLIFIDLNAPWDPGVDPKVHWGDRAVARLEKYETQNLKPGTEAYVFLSNLPFHRSLRDGVPTAVAPFGLGIADFNRPGEYRLSQAYLLKQKHIDAHNIAKSLSKYPQLPLTLDGRLPSEVFDGSERVRVGGTYKFDSVEGGVIGTVTSACVSEGDRAAFVAIWTQDERAIILKYPMSDSELADYRQCPSAYFSELIHAPTSSTDRFDQFESLVETHEGFDREYFLGQLKDAPDIEALRLLPDMHLRVEYCERLVAVLEQQQSKPAA